MSLASEDALERFNEVGTKLIFTDDSGSNIVVLLGSAGTWFNEIWEIF